RPEWRGNAAPADRRPHRPQHGQGSRTPRARNHPHPPHLRPPRGRAAGRAGQPWQRARAREPGCKGGCTMKIAFYGSSLLSAYWNGAATYYRGIIRALAGLGYEVTFYEPDVYDRQKNRDIDPPDW